MRAGRKCVPRNHCLGISSTAQHSETFLWPKSLKQKQCQCSHHRPWKLILFTADSAEAKPISGCAVRAREPYLLFLLTCFSRKEGPAKCPTLSEWFMDEQQFGGILQLKELWITSDVTMRSSQPSWTYASLASPSSDPEIIFPAALSSFVRRSDALNVKWTSGSLCALGSRKSTLGAIFGDVLASAASGVFSLSFDLSLSALAAGAPLGSDFAAVDPAVSAMLLLDPWLVAIRFRWLASTISWICKHKMRFVTQGLGTFPPKMEGISLCFRICFSLISLWWEAECAFNIWGSCSRVCYFGNTPPSTASKFILNHCRLSAGSSQDSCVLDPTTLCPVQQEYRRMDMCSYISLQKTFNRESIWFLSAKTWWCYKAHKHTA